MDIPDLGDVTQVAVSGGENPFACALRRNGSVACWGENGSEQVTAGTCSGVSVKRPRTILGLDVLPSGREPTTCDYDGDGFAAPSDDCDGDDCADEDASVHPGAADDVGDEVDQSCDGIDGVDGDGDAEASLESGGTDCDDGDPEIGQRGHPDVPNDGVDQNCDGTDPIDADGDGFVSIASAGDDCDDADPAVFPLAEGDWLREHVDDGIGVPSLAIDLLGAAHAAYFAVEDERGLVRYATNDSGEWIVSDVGADEDNIGGFPRLKVDEDGVAHIVYEAERRDDTAFLRYASNASGSWAIEDVGRTLDSEWSIFGPVTLAIGADREPHVVWIDTSGDLVHAVRRDEVWDRETIASGIGVDWYGSDPALSIDAAGALHVSYTQIFEDRDALLRHASNAGGQWRFDTIDQLGIWSRLATSAAGTVHAVYAFAPEGCNAGACDLTPRHATYADGAWETEDIEGYGDFAVDEAGLLHVSAFAGYLTNAGGGWSHERLFERVEERPIPPCTLALDPDGLPHLACQLTRVTQDPDDEGVNHFFRGIPDGRDDDCDGAAW